MTRRVLTDAELAQIAHEIFNGMCDAGLSPADSGAVIAVVMGFIAYAGEKDEQDAAIDIMATKAKQMRRSLIMKEKH